MSSSDAQPVDSLATAEAPDAVGVFRIWPGNGTAPGSEDWTCTAAVHRPRRQ